MNRRILKIGLIVLGSIIITTSVVVPLAIHFSILHYEKETNDKLSKAYEDFDNEYKAENISKDHIAFKDNDNMYRYSNNKWLKIDIETSHFKAIGNNKYNNLEPFYVFDESEKKTVDVSLYRYVSYVYDDYCYPKEGYEEFFFKVPAEHIVNPYKEYGSYFYTYLSYDFSMLGSTYPEDVYQLEYYGDFVFDRFLGYSPIAIKDYLYLVSSIKKLGNSNRIEGTITLDGDEYILIGDDGIKYTPNERHIIERLTVVDVFVKNELMVVYDAHTSPYGKLFGLYDGLRVSFVKERVQVSKTDYSNGEKIWLDTASYMYVLNYDSSIANYEIPLGFDTLLRYD